MAISDRGFASMDESKQREIASKGGKSSSGNFKHNTSRASAAGKKGAKAQPIEAKALGGKNSHKGTHS
jgi:uncharacterized protein